MVLISNGIQVLELSDGNICKYKKLYFITIIIVLLRLSTVVFVTIIIVLQRLSNGGFC